MSPAIFLRSPLAAWVAAALACAPADAAPVGMPVSLASGAPCSRGAEMGPIVKMAVGKAQLLRLEAPATRILLGNPENAQATQPTASAPTGVGLPPPLPQGNPAPGGQQNTRRPGVADVDVLLLSPHEIYLLGKTVGSTNIAMVDRTGRCTVIDVVVGMDTAALTASLKELLPAEGQIKVSSAADSLVLTGMVSDAAAADRAVDIAGAYVRKVSGGAQPGRSNDNVINMLSVAAPQQVMLEVKVAEIAKALLDQFGINFSRAYAASDGSMIRFLSGLFGGQGLLAGQISKPVFGTVGGGAVGSLTNGPFTSATTAPAGDASIGGTTTTIPIAIAKGVTNISIDAQKQDGLVKILAEPTVMAISGQEGSFLAGGTVFMPIANNNGMGGTTITLQEQTFGISLKFTPTVLGDGRINLKVNPEVSELLPQGVTITAVNTSGTQILPAFTVRRASTTVQLMDGQSFAIGGLIKNNVSANITAFPFLGELPVLGALFRSTSFRNDRSELVFVITPRLVRPLPPNYVLPTDGFTPPSRADVMLNGRLEGTRSDPPPAAAPDFPGDPRTAARGPEAALDRQPPAVRANPPAATDAGTETRPAAPDPGGFEVK